MRLPATPYELVDYRPLSRVKRIDVFAKLTPEEFAFARHVGEARQREAEAVGRRDRYGFEGLDPIDNHIHGAASEMLVAKALRRTWLPVVEDPKTLPSDVGSNIQVRHTRHPTGRLILHPADQDDQRFVLVRPRYPEHVIVGWILGRDGKKEKWWEEPIPGRAAFFVPNKELHQLDSW